MRRAGIVVVGLLAWPLLTDAAFIPENQRNILTVTFNVSPSGDDSGDGSSAQPFKTLVRAQRAVRSVNAKANAVVLLGSGVYRLTEPLQFGAADGGQDGTTVTWQAGAGASPVIAGSVSVGDRYNNNTLEANHVVAQGAWPAEARAVMENAGIEKDAGVPECGGAQ